MLAHAPTLRPPHTHAEIQHRANKQACKHRGAGTLAKVTPLVRAVAVVGEDTPIEFSTSGA